VHRHMTTTANPSQPAETTGPSQGAVVLDIGGDRGAIVLRTPNALEGVEIEIRRVPAAWDGTHVAVRSWPSGRAPVFAAVFAGLREGAYELRLRPDSDCSRVRRVEVTGGAVTDISWSGERRFV
jgi:hypothetical protein